MDSLLLVVLGAAIVLTFGYLKKRLWSFVAQRPGDYVEGQPQFDLRTHLNGPVVCEGVIYGPMGRVSSRFDADFDVQWTGNNGIMKEHFRYDDGSTQTRCWRLSTARARPCGGRRPLRPVGPLGPERRRGAA